MGGGSGGGTGQNQGQGQGEGEGGEQGEGNSDSGQGEGPNKQYAVMVIASGVWSSTKTGSLSGFRLLGLRMSFGIKATTNCSKPTVRSAFCTSSSDNRTRASKIPRPPTTTRPPFAIISSAS